MITGSMIREKKIIQNKLKDMKAELNNMPNGRLECHVRKVPNKEDKYKWYLVKNEERLYLPKTEIELAKRLAYKRTIRKQIAEYENQLLAIDTYLTIVAGEKSNMLSSAAERTINKNNDLKHNKKNKEVDRLANLYVQQKNKNLEEWINADYFDWNNHPESLTIKSQTGRIVRSRIEAIIDETLTKHGLYYRYENPTELSGRVIHPDFTIIHPLTGKTIIWEHLGRLDLESYKEDTIEKFRLYIHNGFYPNLNLIMTSELKEDTLDLQVIEEIIELFLT